MVSPALERKRTSLDGHSDEIASPDKDVEGDHNGDVGACGEEHSQTKVWRVTTMASLALKKKRTLSDMYEALVGADLGRKLPVGCAKLKNLPPSTKATLVAILAELTPSGIEVNLTDQACNSALEWGLRKSIDSALPKTHNGAAYENPLCTVLSALHNDNGSPLKGMTIKQLQQQSYTYFTWSNAEHDMVQYMDKQLKGTIHEDTKNVADDLCIVEGWNANAQVESKKAGFTMMLGAALHRTHDIMLPFDRSEDACGRNADAVAKYAEAES